ncbi:MAG TPA: hypothetical protein VGM21_00635 [Actinomycetota bacterium]|jgi:hypothetical protein
MNVVLISRDHRLGVILTMALPARERLTVLDSPAEVSEKLEAEIDAVVLDLPADSRRDAYQELRQRYEGRVVVPVDNAMDTSGWPPDAKRRFLVRPFQVADLIARVQDPKETSVAERAATHRRRFRWNRHQFPALKTPPTRTEEPWTAAGDDGEPPAAANAAAEQPSQEEAVAEEAAEQASHEEEVPAVAETTAEESPQDELLAAAGEHAPVELADTDEAPETVEFVMDAEAEAAAGEQAEADGDEAVVAEAEHDETTAETGVEDGEAAAEAEDDEPTAPGEDHEDDESLLGELQGLVLAGVGGEQQPDAAEAQTGSPDAESPDGERDQDASQPGPALPVQAGVAMAKAVALQQWLEAEEARRHRRRRRLVVANVAGGLVLLLAGIGVGRALVPEQPRQATTLPQPPRQEVQVQTAPPPASCSEAMDNADQVISYLVAKIRDERLSRSIQAYGANARACRSSER